jgi:hypothetical protein
VSVVSGWWGWQGVNRDFRMCVCVCVCVCLCGAGCGSEV